MNEWESTEAFIPPLTSQFIKSAPGLIGNSSDTVNYWYCWLPGSK